QKMAARFRPLHEAAPQVPRALSAAVARALSANPAERFLDCLSFSRAVLQAVPPTSPPTQPPAANPAPPDPLAPAVPDPKDASVLRVSCPWCGNRLRLTSGSREAWIRVQCPGCSQRFLAGRGGGVPGPTDADVPLLPEAPPLTLPVPTVPPHETMPE